MDNKRSNNMILDDTERAVINERRVEFEALVSLLLAHKSVDGEEAERLAHWVAFSCLGNNHLWQDMKLNNRMELSGLLRDNFRPLFDKNTKDMKWKRFFYKQICGWEGFHM